MILENHTKRKVLAISSLPTVGNAGVKNIIGILGGDVLPVPTLVISGLGNMAGNKRFNLPYRDILEQTFWMARQQSYRLIVYTGYFNLAQQVWETIELLESFRDQVCGIVVDPVSGDNGKPYVGAGIIKRLPALSAMADWLIPNETELKLLLDMPMDTTLGEATARFREKYPETKLLITGIRRGDRIGNYLLIGNSGELIEHQFYAHHFAGTGDAFAALFMKFHLLEEMEATKAVRKAGDHLAVMIGESIEAQRPVFDLQLNLLDRNG